MCHAKEVCGYNKGQGHVEVKGNNSVLFYGVACNFVMTQRLDTSSLLSLYLFTINQFF